MGIFKPVKPKIVFAFSPQYRYGGGTVMRGEQLSEIAIKYIGEKYSISFKSVEIKFKNSAIFLTKMATATVSIKHLALLKKRNNIIIFDANDGRIDDEKIPYANIIVVSSSVGLREYKSRYPDKDIRLVDHHVDPRIRPRDRVEDLTVGYFGEPTNAFLTDKIEKEVQIVPVSTATQNDLSWIGIIPNYNLHYAVRRRQDFDDFKPATKIFTAARCGSNVVIQESEEEAIRWLGNDYPYIVKGEVSEQSVLDMLQKVKDTYESPVWYDGLARMESINNRIKDELIAKQLDKIFSFIYTI